MFYLVVENILDTTMECLEPITRNKANLLGQQTLQTSSTAVPILDLPSSMGERISPNELVERGNTTEIVEKTLVQHSPFNNKDRTTQDEDDVFITRSAPVTPRNLFKLDFSLRENLRFTPSPIMEIKAMMTKTSTVEVQYANLAKAIEGLKNMCKIRIITFLS